MPSIKRRPFFTSHCLFEPEGASALNYLKKRGIVLPVIKKFGLGYAPESWDMLLHAFAAKGLLRKRYEGGLAKGKRRKDKKTYDMFRNRVMFPIINASGKVIAFGGRVTGQQFAEIFEFLGYRVLIKGKTFMQLIY